jgi:hypothetical protein
LLGYDGLLHITQAAELNVSLQLCMMDPIHALMSTTVPAVTNGRASKDNTGDPVRGLVIGLSSMLLHAVGIWPSRDNIRTNSTEKQAQEGNCLNTVLALLAGGPYG